MTRMLGVLAMLRIKADMFFWNVSGFLDLYFFALAVHQ